MIDVALPLNSFPRKALVPTGDQVIILTASQLKAIISAAVTEAIQSFKDRISSPKTVITQSNGIADLKASLETLEFHLSKQIAEDRRRITSIEEQQPRTAPPTGTKTITRLSRIKAILKSRGATTFKEIERILGIAPREMVRLTKKLDMRFYEITRRPGDAREKVIRLRSQIG